MMASKSSRTKKNVTLVPYEKNGVTSYKLLGPTGEIRVYTVFSDTLLTSPFNTRRTYCQHLADFFDYLFEAGFHLLSEGEARLALTKFELRTIIECWHDYLVIGAASGKELVRLVTTTLPRRLCDSSTSSKKHAALRSFLALSEQLRAEASELVSIGMLISKVEYDVSPLFNEINSIIKVSGKEKAAQMHNSMLAGVIHSRDIATRKATILHVSPGQPYDPSSAFPLEIAQKFIDALPTYRDKALYSLYAASGCRSSEGLQLLLEDIKIDTTDPSRNKVLLVDPKHRKNHPSYLALTAMERDRLSWKGRETSEAFLIEPFASMFFSYLQEYLRKEYYPHNRHSFVFQILKSGVARGQPYFLASAQSRQQIFDTAARVVGVPESVSGPHSFRHAYGTYLLNYFPLGGDKYGLPMGIIRVMMGHKSLSSTEKYAMHDRDLINVRISLANILLYRSGSVRSFVEQKLDAMRAQVANFEKLSKTLLLEKVD
nr:tyrosine-type recombinase/integrase [uncultured Undibacterium sp.]